MTDAADRQATELLAAAARGEPAMLSASDARWLRRIEKRVKAQRPDAVTVIGGTDGTPCYQPGVAIDSTTITVLIPETTNVSRSRYRGGAATS